MALCKGCQLGKHLQGKIVIGRGDIPAKILFIGEGPGKVEEMFGEAFVGPSGKLLDRMISDSCTLINISKPPSYYITNTVLCRPWIWNQNSDEYGENRTPLKSEVLACTKNILTIYYRVNPKIVIFVGKVSETYYKKEFPDSIRITHPAAHLRYGGVSSPMYQYDIRNLSEVFKGLK